MALKLGLNLGYWGIGPQGEEAADLVKAAERAGFDSVWVAESYGSDVVSVLAWLAPQTTTIRLGAAILQVPARPPAAAAMAGATIEQVQQNLTLPVIQELNARVDLDKEKPADVAQDYLSESGYID